MENDKKNIWKIVIQTRYEKLCELSKRKETVLSTIEEQGKLTPELKARISACWNATELEDIYLPFKPKRKTRADRQFIHDDGNCLRERDL